MKRNSYCRCDEIGSECQFCLARIARQMDHDGDPMLPRDYDRLEAGPWWSEVPTR